MAWNDCTTNTLANPFLYNANPQMLLAEISYKHFNGKNVRILTGDCDWEVTDSTKVYTKCPGCSLELYDELNELIKKSNKCNTPSCGWVRPGGQYFNTNANCVAPNTYPNSPAPWPCSFSPNLISPYAQFIWWTPTQSATNEPTSTPKSINECEYLLFRVEIV